MNCDALHRHILSLEQPKALRSAARAHLKSCPGCRTWYRQLLLVEGQTRAVRVPPPQKKDAFLLAFQEAAAVPASARPVHSPAPRHQVHERGIRKMSLAVAMAAALLLVVLGTLGWQRSTNLGPRTGPPLSHLDRQLRDDPRWTQATTPDSRVVVLATLADEVQTNMREMVAVRTLAELEREVKLYREIVQRLIGTEAPQIAPGDRKRLLTPIADRLARAESEATRLALQMPDLAAPFTELAAVARDGDRQLRGLLV